ncbi:MAG: hypothetical protein ACREM2_08070 [Vulcanimicrobiaceae bacterium]
MGGAWFFAAALVLALCPFGGGSAAKVAAALPTPSSAAVGDTPPPLSATATPSPQGTLVRFSGQLLDFRDGFAFFTTGDAFRLAQNVAIDAAQSGKPTSEVPATGAYARADFDAATGQIVELDLSSTPLAPEASYEAVKGFAVALSPPLPNPDLGAKPGFDGKPVLVTFTVRVPPKTPFAATVYLATDASGWSATAVEMNRVDALHYRVTRRFPSGTILLYRYTLGSWRSAEVDAKGLERTPRRLVVRNLDVQEENDAVDYWGSSDPFAPDLGVGVPTPFNPVPFPIPHT